MELAKAKERSEKRRQFMLEGSLLFVIVTIAGPQVVTMLVDSIYNMADAYFVSNIGDAAISAVGINDSLLMIIRAIAMGFGMGSASFISRALGAGKDETASRAAVTTLFTAMGILSILMVLGLMYITPLVNFLGATDSIRGYTIDYAKWILLTAPIAAADTILSQLLRSEGNTLYSMIGMTTGCILNIILDPIFITTWGMGVAGAAIATDISKFISFLILLYPFATRKTVINMKPSLFTPTKELYSELARMGIPTMVRTGLMSVATILINNTAAAFGDAALAAITIANKSLRFVSSAIMGFSHGFQPIAGYSYGAGKYDRVLKAFRVTLTIGAVIGIVLGAALGIFAHLVIAIFSADSEIVSLGMTLIRSQSITMVPHVWTMISTGFFQAQGKAMKAGALGLSRQLIALIPCVVILSRVFGVTGLTLAQAASDVISCTVAIIMVIPAIKELINLDKGIITIDQVTGGVLKVYEESDD